MDERLETIVGDLALMARMTSGEMDRPLLEWLRASRYPKSLGLALNGAKARQAEAILFSAVARLPEVGEKEGREALAADFSSLFLSGGTEGFASESYWFGDQSQQRLQVVENWYRRHGYEIADRYHRPADSLAFELGFLAHLLDDTEALVHSKNFLNEHLLAWTPRFFETASQRCRTDFYRGLLLLLEAYLPSLDEELSKVRGDILSVPA